MEEEPSIELVAIARHCVNSCQSLDIVERSFHLLSQGLSKKQAADIIQLGMSHSASLNRDKIARFWTAKYMDQTPRPTIPEYIFRAMVSAPTLLPLLTTFITNLMMAGPADPDASIQQYHETSMYIQSASRMLNNDSSIHDVRAQVVSYLGLLNLTTKEALLPYACPITSIIRACVVMRKTDMLEYILSIAPDMEDTLLRLIRVAARLNREKCLRLLLAEFIPRGVRMLSVIPMMNDPAHVYRLLSWFQENHILQFSELMTDNMGLLAVRLAHRPLVFLSIIEYVACEAPFLCDGTVFWAGMTQVAIEAMVNDHHSIFRAIMSLPSIPEWVLYDIVHHVFDNMVPHFVEVMCSLHPMFVAKFITDDTMPIDVMSILCPDGKLKLIKRLMRVIYETEIDERMSLNSMNEDGSWHSPLLDSITNGRSSTVQYIISNLDSFIVDMDALVMCISSLDGDVIKSSKMEKAVFSILKMHYNESDDVDDVDDVEMGRY